MTTIQILQEAQPQGGWRYRAIYERHHAAGATPGAALDALEDELPANSGTVVILQKFKSDRYFEEPQQARLTQLMERLQESRAHGLDLAPSEMAELEALIDLELRATAQRATDIATQIAHQ